MHRSIHILHFLLPLCSLSYGNLAESELLLLENEELVVGVKAELGGRIMLFRRVDGENVLHSDPADWSLTDEEIPKAENAPNLTEYHGHIVWVGPASKWWDDTDGNLFPPDKTFHPDPFLIYDRCEVLEHSASRLVLQGNVSPLNDMRMRKVFEFGTRGQLNITVSVTNKRHRPVTWNIWSNTRFQPAGISGFSVPAKGNLSYAFSAWRPYTERPLPYEIRNRVVSFSRPSGKDLENYSFYGKLSFSQYRPIIAVYKDNLFVKKVGAKSMSGKFPEEHSPLEIYQRYTTDARGNLMELEMHSPEFTLAPGESAEFSERWTLLQLPLEEQKWPFDKIVTESPHTQ